MISAELRQLPATEKLKLIEALWDDLLDNENDVPALPWHQEELQRTEAAYAAGDVEAVDWRQAKKALRSRFE
ncbi:addiction module protein [Methylomonas sp. UP202]|uniref:addiction module protein n=1 Tax=Methylomonas sp. UP202 TaxID=3040943 RepID=UPI0024791208|nr:addiction module protein [Methylomonas sp. UP202]WGS87696.1 addiction module protein [Methylomonas sp. UP202]